MPSPFEMVREFHERFGHPIADSLQVPSDARVEFRWDLIHEEFLEVSEAVDEVLDEGDPTAVYHLLKEMADLIYVLEGFAVEIGANLDTVVAEVHRSNMSKLGEDGKPIYRADSKVLKGPNYTEADIAAALGH